MNETIWVTQSRFNGEPVETKIYDDENRTYIHLEPNILKFPPTKIIKGNCK